MAALSFGAIMVNGNLFVVLLFPYLTCKTGKVNREHCFAWGIVRNVSLDNLYLALADVVGVYFPNRQHAVSWITRRHLIRFTRGFLTVQCKE